MKNIFILLLALTSFATWADDGTHENAQQSRHEHIYEKLIDGEKVELDTERFNAFLKDLSNVQIAIVSVHGIVCDFCARGIEKTFIKDSSIIKIDVDLNTGKVFIAYELTKEIDFEDIKEKVLSNGQTATSIKIIKI